MDELKRYGMVGPMAPTENIYNPKATDVYSPAVKTDIFGNKAVTVSTPGMLSSTTTVVPHIDESNLGYESIQVVKEKYSADLTTVTSTYRPEMFPIQLMADLNMKPANAGDKHIISEDYNSSNQFYDLNFDKLRIAQDGIAGVPREINDSSNNGGKIIWRSITNATVNLLLSAYDGTTNVTTLANGTTVTQTPLYDTDIYIPSSGNRSGKKLLVLAWSLASGERCKAGLDASPFVDKAASLLESKFYRRLGTGSQTIQEATSNTAWFGWCHEKTSVDGPAISTVHAMLPDMCYKNDAGEQQLNEINVRLDSFFMRSDRTQFVMILDFTYNNMIGSEVPWGSTVNKIILEEYKDKSTNFFGGYTRLRNEVLLGMAITVPTPLKQGFSRDDVKGLASGLLYDVHHKQNFCQLIASPMMKITGTMIAAQGALKNNPIPRMRDNMMLEFKRARNSMMLFGRGASQRRVTGTDETINESAGLFCYDLFPIRYLRSSLSAYGSTSNNAKQIYEFFKNFARSLFAHQPNAQESEVKTVFCSKFMKATIDRMIKEGLQYINPTGDNVGYNNVPGGSNVSFKMKYDEIQTPYGNIRLMIDPALDQMTEVMLPSFVGPVNPKTMLIAIDKSKISTCSLRNATLKGNIQNPGDDFVLERIDSEETFELLSPINHVVMIVDIKG